METDIKKMYYCSACNKELSIEDIASNMKCPVCEASFLYINLTDTEKVFKNTIHYTEEINL